MADVRDEIVKFLYQLGESPEEVGRSLEMLKQEGEDTYPSLNPLECPVMHALLREFPKYRFSVGYNTLSYDKRDAEPFRLDVDKMVELPREITDFIRQHDRGGV